MGMIIIIIVIVAQSCSSFRHYNYHHLNISVYVFQNSPTVSHHLEWALCHVSLSGLKWVENCGKIALKTSFKTCFQYPFLSSSSRKSLPLFPPQFPLTGLVPQKLFQVQTDDRRVNNTSALFAFHVPQSARIVSLSLFLAIKYLGSLNRFALSLLRLFSSFV